MSSIFTVISNYLHLVLISEQESIFEEESEEVSKDADLLVPLEFPESRNEFKGVLMPADKSTEGLEVNVMKSPRIKPRDKRYVVKPIGVRNVDFRYLIYSRWKNPYIALVSIELYDELESVGIEIGDLALLKVLPPSRFLPFKNYY